MFAVESTQLLNENTKKFSHIQRYLICLGYLVVVFMLLGVIAIIMQALGLSAQASTEKLKSMNAFDVLGLQLLQAIAFILPLLIFIKVVPLKLFPWFALPTPKQWKVASLGYLATYISIVVLFSVIGVKPEQYEDMVIDKGPLSMSVFLLAIAMVAPILEEVVFRGLILRTLLEGRELGKDQSVIYAILFSGTVFGLMHISGANWAALVGVTMLGLFFAFLGAYTRSLFLPIVFHSFHNLWTGVLKVYGPSIVQ